MNPPCPSCGDEMQEALNGDSICLNTHDAPTFPPASPGPGCISSLAWDHDNDEVWISVGGSLHGKASVETAKNLATSLSQWVASVERRRAKAAS